MGIEWLVQNHILAEYAPLYKIPSWTVFQQNTLFGLLLQTVRTRRGLRSFGLTYM
jgi:hypothetical protein